MVVTKTTDLTDDNPKDRHNKRGRMPKMLFPSATDLLLPRSQMYREVNEATNEAIEKGKLRNHCRWKLGGFFFRFNQQQFLTFQSTSWWKL